MNDIANIKEESPVLPFSHPCQIQTDTLTKCLVFCFFFFYRLVDILGKRLGKT